MYELLGAAVDAVHGLAMLVWGFGLPLLFLRRFPRLTRAYAVYSLVFLVSSVLSYLLLGECFLTAAARALYEAGHHPELRTRTRFIVRFVEFVAGVRPREQTAVLFWEAAIFLGSIATLAQLVRGRASAHGDPTSQAHT